MEKETVYIASVSRGKDSTKMLDVIFDKGYPIDHIIATDVWFDEETPAELPEMVEYKDYYDAEILKRYGMPVTRIHALRGGQVDTYCRWFNQTTADGKKYGFPSNVIRGGAVWCKRLKQVNVLRSLLLEAQRGGQSRTDLRIPIQGRSELQQTQEDGRDTERGATAQKSSSEMCGFPVRKSAYCHHLKTKEEWTKFSKWPEGDGRINIIQYIGICSDEGGRTEKWKGRKGYEFPLIDQGITEQECYDWCKENNLLSPTYTHSFRDGCWFCHNQGVNQLRYLRKNHPELWEKLLKLDDDSPVSFHADGHTVHDFDRRFQWEDEGYKPCGKQFRWADIDEAQMNIYQFL